MNQMEIFKNPEFGSIRVIEENGKYLFCGTDVADALGYSNPRDAIIRHCRYVVKRDAPHPQSPDRKIRYLPFSSMTRILPNSGFLKISIWFMSCLLWHDKGGLYQPPACISWLTNEVK